MIAQLDRAYIRTRPAKIWGRLVSYGLFEGRPVTTRGRWINPLVFLLFRTWTKLPQLKRVEKPLFIIGTGRSGTTLTGVLLSMHRNVSFLNEPKALWHEIYGQEDIIGSYSKGEAYYRLSEENLEIDSIVKAHRLYGANLTLTGSRRVLDKYPELIFRIPFVKKIFPDARFLFIVRDGRDTLQSIETWSERLGKRSGEEVYDWWGVNDRKWKLMCEQLLPASELLKEKKEGIRQFLNHKDRATVEWVLTMEEGLQAIAADSSSIRMFKYEELLANPRETLSDLLEFADLKQDEKIFEYAFQILEKHVSKKSVNIHTALKPAFEKLMKQLKYEI